MARGDTGKDLVQRPRAAHVVDLLKDHGRELAVALRKHGVRSLGQAEQQRRPPPTAPVGLAGDETIALEVGQVLADGVGGDAEVVRDRFRARPAPAPQQLEDFHPGRTAGDHEPLIRSLGATLAQARNGNFDLLQAVLDKSEAARKLVPGGDRGMPMIKQASRAIEHMTARERRIQRAKYARRNKMHYIDKLLNELEMLNLADQRQMPPVLSVAINKVIEESPEVTVLAQAKPASVMEAMDALYEIQDSLMYNQIEDE